MSPTTVTRRLPPIPNQSWCQHRFSFPSPRKTPLGVPKADILIHRPPARRASSVTTSARSLATISANAQELCSTQARLSLRSRTHIEGPRQNSGKPLVSPNRTANGARNFADGRIALPAWEAGHLQPHGTVVDFPPFANRREDRGVAQLGLERMVRDHEVVGSNPITPTDVTRAERNV